MRSRTTHRLIDQLFNPPCMPSWTVRNVERDHIVRAGREHVVWAVRLQIALKGPLATKRSVELRSVANLPPGVEVHFTSVRIIETFQDNKSSEPLYSSDRTFVNLIGGLETRTADEGSVYRRVDLLALQARHVDLEVPERILGQPNFIGRGSPSDIHSIGLPHHGDDRSGICPNPCSVEGTAGGVNIEPSEDFGGRGIKAENNLDTTVRVLSWPFGHSRLS